MTTSFVPLVIALITGVNGFHLLVIQVPHLRFDSSQTPFYSCKFIYKVKCSWRVDDQAINITDTGYTWMTGNGSNTNDCSVQAKSKYRQNKNKVKLGNKVQCTGIGDGPIIANIGDSVELQCTAPDKANCNWTRNSTSIEIGNYYTYTQDQDCSIRINRIRPIDLTFWICVDAVATVWEGATYIIERLNNTDSTTIAVTANFSNGTTTSIGQPNDTVSTTLIATGLTLLAATIIGVACVIRKRNRSKNTANSDHNSIHNDVGGERAAPGSIANANFTFNNVRATTSQNQAEDDDGYLISTPRLINKNAKNTQCYIQQSNSESHVYETINDDYYSDVEHPTTNIPTYTVLI